MGFEINESLVQLTFSRHVFGLAAFLAVFVALSLIVYFFLSFPKRPEWVVSAVSKLGLTALHPFLSVVLSLLWITLFLAVFGSLLWVLAGTAERALAVDTTGARDLRWSLLALAANVAALGAIVTLPFTLIRMHQNARQTSVVEQTHITQQINDAVALLSATRTEKNGEVENSIANVEQRCGALVTLQKISRMSSEDADRIFSVVSAYVRENATGQVFRAKENFPEKFKTTIDSFRYPRADIAIALSILQEVNDAKGNRLKLGLQSTDFSSLQLQSVELKNANLHVTSFRDAILVGAKFDGSFINITDFHNADFRAASFKNCTFNSANFDSVYEFERAIFDGSCFSNIDLSSVRITQEQLDSIYADKSVIIPEHLVRPQHWNNRRIDPVKLWARRDAWRRYAGYTVEENPS